MRIGSLLAPLFALLVIVAGIFARRRVNASRGRLVLTDRDVRQIEDEGQIATREHDSLDHDEIRAEEDAFWEQTWD